jgi:hypothetical protein
MNFNNLLIGLAMVVFGVLAVKYTFWLRNTTGPQEWLERYTGSGSTYGMYKIFGVILILFGFMTATGLADPVMRWLLSPFLNIFKNMGGV